MVTGVKYIPDVAAEDYELNRLLRSLHIFLYGCNIGDILSALMKKDQNVKSKK